MRGKGCKAVAVLTLTRITPACAGKSAAGCTTGGQIRDHPRVCGEKTILPDNVIRGTGSPPRVRGKVSHFLLVHDSIGITPACAGKSLHDILVDNLKRDHPRVCGEKQLGQDRIQEL